MTTIRRWLSLFLAVAFTLAGGASWAAEKGLGIALISDLHVAKSNEKSLSRLLKRVMGHANIDLVAILGDVCRDVGTTEEYALVAKALKPMKKVKEIVAIPGNHDFRYADTRDSNGKRVRGPRSLQESKLRMFQETLMPSDAGQPYYFSRRTHGHLLIFLPVDELGSGPLCQVSTPTLGLMLADLAVEPKVPTIVFCHAPLQGSYVKKSQVLKPRDANVQPHDEMWRILEDHPQVFLWVAGHVHLHPGKPTFADASANQLKRRTGGPVTCVHVPNVSPKESWYLTLRLWPEKATVHVYDGKGQRLKDYDRVFKHDVSPKPAKKGQGAQTVANDPPAQVEAQPAAPAIPSNLRMDDADIFSE